MFAIALAITFIALLATVFLVSTVFSDMSKDKVSPSAMHDVSPAGA